MEMRLSVSTVSSLVLYILVVAVANPEELFTEWKEPVSQEVTRGQTVGVKQFSENEKLVSALGERSDNCESVDGLCVQLCPSCDVPTNVEPEEWLGVDMCPERGQPMADPIKVSLSLPLDSNNLVQELRNLLKVQQSQLDQLSDLLHKVCVSLPTISEEAIENEHKAQTTQSRMASERIEKKVKENLDDSESRNKDALPEVRNSMHQQLAENFPSDPMGHPDSKGDKSRLTSGLSGGMTVARYRPAWSDHFQFLSAVKVEGEVSCLHILPQEAEHGTSRYVAIGDTTGRIYLFICHGDLLLDYSTSSSASITVMLSYSVGKNETILVTGHTDGAVLVHRIWESIQQGSGQGDDVSTLSSIEFLYAMVPPFTIENVPGKDSHGPLSSGFSKKEKVETGAGKEEGNEVLDTSKTVLNLEMYRVGKMRYILVSDMASRIQVFRENGTLYGVADLPSRPLAFLRNPSAQRLLFLTELGVGSLDLRSMFVRSGPCDGLNNSTVVAYAFDVAGRSRANGFTVDGDLVHVSIAGDVFHFECTVKRKTKLEVGGPYAPHAIKGYLLVATPDQVLVFNTSQRLGFTYASFGAGGPKPVFTASVDEISLAFVSTPIARSVWPVMACNRDKLVVVGFGHGYVGIFRSNLPVQRPTDFSSRLWSSPMLIAVLVLLVVWQLFSRRRDPTPSALNYRNVETQRSGFRDRESLGESRHYRSPPRGFVGSPNPGYGSVPANFPPSNSDPGSYSARREPLFSSTEIVGEAWKE